MFDDIAVFAEGRGRAAVDRDRDAAGIADPDIRQLAGERSHRAGGVDPFELRGPVDRDAQPGPLRQPDLEGVVQVRERRGARGRSLGPAGWCGRLRLGDPGINAGGNTC